MLFVVLALRVRDAPRRDQLDRVGRLVKDLVQRLLLVLGRTL